MHWSEYGEKPHEIFKTDIHDYTIQEFSRDIDRPLNVIPLYRFTTKSYKIGDIIELDIPTSWSTNLEILGYMAEPYETKTFLQINNTSRGIDNYMSNYPEEEEYILTPMKLKIVNKHDDIANVTILPKSAFIGSGLFREDITYEEELLKFIYDNNTKNAIELLNSVDDIDLTYKDYGNGYTPLHVAIKYNRIEIVKKLLDKLTDEDLIITNKNGMTPLHLVTHKEIIKILLKRLSSKDLVIKNDKGQTPLYVAVSYNRIKIVEILIEKLSGKDLMIPNNDGYTPLHVASNNIKIVNMFLEKLSNEDLIIPDNNGNTYLHIAIRYNWTKIIKLYLDRLSYKGLIIQDNNGNTPLHVAIKNELVIIVQLLLERLPKEARIIENKDGHTPLNVINKNIQFYGENDDRLAIRSMLQPMVKSAYRGSE